MVRVTRGMVAIAGGGLVAINVIAVVTMESEHNPARSAISVDWTAAAAQTEVSSEPTVELSPSQLAAFTIAPVGTYLFPLDKHAVGSIDFDENLSVQVYPPNQGKILTTLAEVGDHVDKGQPLYTVDSPDLIQAESNLIGAAATLGVASKELARARDLYGHDSGGVSQREYDQAVSDDQTAEGNLTAAQSAVRVFGKSDAEMDRLVASRKIDPALVVVSPITGQVTARDAQPGLLVEPGNPPAPYAILARHHQVDARERARKRQPVVSRGPASRRDGDGVPGPILQGYDLDDLSGGRSEHAPSHHPLRDRRSHE